MREIRLSPSAIQSLMMCPLKYLFNYIYNLEPDKEKDSYRVGTIWGRCHEILGMLPQGKCPDCFQAEEIREDCYLCEGSGVLPSDLMDAVLRYLNFAYSEVPENKTAEQMEVERIQILYSLSGYKWMFPDINQKYRTMGSEVWINLPVKYPKSNRKFPMARIVGKIDHIIQDLETGLYYIKERKSTSRDLEGDKYWGRLKTDVQVTTYLWAARKYQRMGYLENIGIRRDEPLIQGIWYDVWHKPTINPKALSQKDSKEFVETGEYCGEKFNISHISGPTDDVFISDKQIITTQGKKEGTYSIFETPEMYGARLLADIAERPNFYFVQREIPRTDNQLEKFEADLVRYATLIRNYEEKDLWVCNDMSCTVPFRCDFYDICQNGLEVGPDDVPTGYRKKFKKENGGENG